MDACKTGGSRAWQPRRLVEHERQRRGLSGRSDYVAGSRVQLQFAFGQVRRLRLAAGLGEENAARTCAGRTATFVFAGGIGKCEDLRRALECGADAARRGRTDSQLLAN